MINPYKNPKSLSKKGNILLVIIFLIGIACTNQRELYHISRVIRSEYWTHQDSLIWELPIADTLQLYDLHIDIRNNNQYPYQNLALEIISIAPDETVTCDTIEYLIATPQGRWLGNGWGSLYVKEYLFKERIHFQQAGQYHLIIRQAMSDRKLKGVESIGVRIKESH